MKNVGAALVGAALLCGLGSSFAQAQMAQYGANLTLEQARKVVAGALAEARRINVPMAIAVVDTSGNLVNFEKMDDTQFGSINVAIDKAVSSALFRRPTRAFQDGVASGGAGLLILQLRGASPVEGGIPITLDGKVVGAIGVSGGTLAQDALCASAGVSALK